MIFAKSVIMMAGVLAMPQAAAVQAAPSPQSAPASAPADQDDIIVSAKADRFRQDARTLIVGRKTFDKGRGEFAADSTLWFHVRRRGGKQTTGDLALRLESGTQSLPLPLDEEGRFVLAPLPPGKWHITANRARRAISVYPLVMTPGTGQYDRRLGDLRLQCRVMWAMIKSEASPLALPLVALGDGIGVCSTSRVGIIASVDRPLASGTLSEAAKAQPVTISPSAYGYRAPLNERSFSNDARVNLVVK